MLRILSVCTVPTDKSGIPNVIFNLLSNFPKDSVKLGYVSINDPSDFYKHKLRDIGAELYIVPRKISHPLRYIRQLAKIAHNYDVIHVHGNSATMVLEMIAAKLGGVKLRIAHSHNTTCNKKVIDWLARPIFHAICNGKLACGVEAGKWLFGDREFKVINNGISTDKFTFSNEKRVAIRKLLNLPLDPSSSYKSPPILIGHIGNFVEAKNHQYLIRIFKEYNSYNPNSKLLLLGSGPLMDEVKSSVDSLGLNDSVVFAGSVDNPQDYMNAMDIIAMPSLYEGLPLTLVEEQANGLPIVAADTITSDANITGNLSYCPISEGDIKTWKKMIEEGLRSQISRGERSRKSVIQIQESGYDVSSAARSLLDYYRMFINE